MYLTPSSTREQILYMLKTQKKLTVTEMAKQLNITEMAVRRHLNTLERDQYIETTLVRKTMGRPMNVFQLSEKGEELFPRNYKSMTLELLEGIDEIGGDEMIQELFARREQRLKNRYLPLLKNKSFQEKINELNRIQQENGYMTLLKENEAGDHVLQEYNCPVAAIAKHYSIACDCELKLFRDILGTENIKRTRCAAKGDDFCEFVIQKA